MLGLTSKMVFEPPDDFRNAVEHPSPVWRYKAPLSLPVASEKTFQSPGIKKALHTFLCNFCFFQLLDNCIRLQESAPTKSGSIEE